MQNLAAKPHGAKMISMLFLMSLMLTRSAIAAEIDITEGRLTHTGSYANRVVAAKNNGGPIATLKIECGFFRGTALLAAGMGFAQNIEAAVRDSADAKHIRADFDPGDHLHANNAGYEAMANAVDLSIFSGRPGKAAAKKK